MVQHNEMAAKAPIQPAATNGAPGDLQASLNSLATVSGSLNPEDLLQKIKLVIVENQELKETIAQNNLALRQQLGLVVRWSQQMEQQQQEQRQQAHRLNEQISTLTQQNAQLRSQVSSGEKTEGNSPRCRELDEMIQGLNTRLSEVQSSLSKVEAERNTLQATKSRIEGDSTLLKCDLTTARGEVERLQLERFELTSSVRELRQQLQNQQHTGQSARPTDPGAATLYDGLNAPHSEEKLRLVKEQLRQEQETTNTLLKELQDTRNQVDSLESEVGRVTEESSLYKERYQHLQQQQQARSTTTAFGQRENKGGDSVSAKEEAAMLREEVGVLEQALDRERQRGSEQRADLARALSDVAKLRNQLSDRSDKTDKTSQNDVYYMAKVKSISEQLDEATAKVVSYEELLSSKNDEIGRHKKQVAEFKAQINEMKADYDSVAVLKAQVEVYLADFNAEREAREQLACDREKLREELRNLHLRNTQLIDELDAYQRKHLNERGSRGASEEPAIKAASDANSAAAAAAASAADDLWEVISNTSANSGSKDKKKKEDQAPELDENLFYCPKCSKSFAQYRPLEEHVNRCLDED